jgi:tRNA 2-selenouridine synthase
MFETRLAERLRAGFSGPCVFEGESRKVGDAIIPESIWRGLRGGVNLEVRAPVARRVQVLSEDYLASSSAREQLAVQLRVIEERMRPRFELVTLLEQDRTPELVEILLEHYYDPLYLHSEKGREYAASFDSTHEVETAEEIARWIESHSTSL